MGFFRRFIGRQDDSSDNHDSSVNPSRTESLFALTKEGYVIAEDIACQYEFAETEPCPHCDGPLKVLAQINRASQGLNELVCACRQCGRRSSIIFDVSNNVYQDWMAEQLGDLYIRNYDGPPRRPSRR